MFFECTPPQNPTPEQLSPPAARSVFDPSLQFASFNPEFRKALGNICSQAERVQRLMKECKTILFERTIEQDLRLLASTIKDPALRLYYVSSDRTLRELVPVLEVVTSRERENFVTGISNLLTSQSLDLDHVGVQLDNICARLTPLEREHVFAKWLEKDFMGRGQCIDALLRSSKSADELVELVSVCGEVKLLSAGGREVPEILACATLISSLRVDLPMVESANLAESRDAMVTKLQELKTLCETSIYRGTDFAITAVKALQGTIGRLESLSGVALTAERLTVLREIARVEGRYCLSVSESGGAQWTLSTLGDLENVLSKIPESVVLHTPLLYEVKLNGNLPNYLYGVRYGNGVVEVGPWTAVSSELVQAYAGVRPLQIVLAHEIGHGIQLGYFATNKGGLSDSSGLGSCGDPRYDFAEYASLSGWSLVSGVSVTALPGGSLVNVDDVEYQLGQVVEFRGQRVVFSLNQGRLYAFRADAKFSHDPYSRSDPWEDWAEAFSEYLYLPERLAHDAPGKFLFFEQEFGRYGVQSSLTKSAIMGANSAYKQRHEVRNRPL